MDISLLGPNDLTENDKVEIEKYIDAVITQHSISILYYSSFEREVLKYFVKNKQYAHKLHIYTFPEFNQLAPDIQQTISFLLKNGAVHKSFYTNQLVVKRSMFKDAWMYILDESDAVVSFFCESKPQLMIPIDIAKKLEKKPFTFLLPRYNSTLLQRSIKEKIRYVG